MSKKHDAFPQVRISPERYAAILISRDTCGYTVTVPAYIDGLLKKGLDAEHKSRKSRKC